MSTTDAYVKYKQKQSQLARIIKEGSECIKPLNMNKFSDLLDTLSNKVASDSFKIQVVGTFKNGKSTFINSFLGSEVLPAYATPTTAVINEVKYGEKERAVLYFKNPLPEHLPSDIPEKTMSHIRKYKKKDIPPIEISYDEIEDYAVIPMGKDPKESLLESPYEKIELFWPLEILKNSVEIIDSPGLNEHETRTRVTLEYLEKSDAVIFVFSALAICSKEEMKFLENNLHQQGFEDIYFIVNRYDQLGSDRNKEKVKVYANQRLKNETTFGERGIFFTSAYHALQGKMNKSEQMYQESGMPEFELSLSDFLTNKKGNIKLSQPARELKRVINDEALFRIIPQQKTMLSSSLDEVKSRYDEAKPRLEALKRKKTQMANRISLLIERMIPEIRRTITTYFNDLSNNVAEWVEEYEPTTEIKITKVKQSVEELINEISDVIKDKLEEDQRIWLNQTLEPLISEKVKDMMASIEKTLENFYVEVDQVRIDISGGATNNSDYDVPLWQRIAGIGGGLLLGDIGLAAAGGAFGFSKEFLKQIGIQIGAYIGLALIGLLNPVTIIAVIGGGLIFGTFNQKKQLVNKVKNEITNNITQEIKNFSDESTDTIIEDIRTKIQVIGQTIVNSMDTEIEEVYIQVEDIIKQLESGQSQVNKRKEELNGCEEKLKILNKELDNFIFQLVQK